MPPKAMKEADEIGRRAPAKLRAEGHNEGSAGMVDEFGDSELRCGEK